MSKNVVELVFKIKDEASKILEKNKNALQSLSRIAKDSERSFDGIGTNARKSADGLNSINRATAETNRNLGQTRQSAQQASQGFDQVGQSADKAAQSIKKKADESKGLNGALGGVSAGLGKFKGLIAGAVAALGTFKVLDKVDELENLSAKIGTSVERISALGVFSKQSGLSVGSLGEELRRLGQNLAQFEASGGGSAANFFEITGLALEDIKGKGDDSVAVLANIAEAIKDMPLDQQNRILRELAGPGLTKLAAGMRDGKEGFEGIVQAAIDSGAAISDIDTMRIQEMNDRLSSAGDKMQKIGTVILAELSPIVYKTIGFFEQMGAKIEEITGGSVAQNLRDFIYYMGMGFSVAFSAIKIRILEFKSTYLSAIAALFVPLTRLIELKNRIMGISADNSPTLRFYRNLREEIQKTNDELAKMPSAKEVIVTYKENYETRKEENERRVQERLEEFQSLRDAEIKSKLEVDQEVEKSRVALISRQQQLEAATAARAAKIMTDQANQKKSDLGTQQQLEINNLRQMNLSQEEFAKRERDIKIRYANEVHEVELNLLRARSAISETSLNRRLQELDQSKNKLSLFDDKDSDEARKLLNIIQDQELSVKQANIAYQETLDSLKFQESAHQRNLTLLNSQAETQIFQIRNAERLRREAEARAAAEREAAEQARLQAEQERRVAQSVDNNLKARRELLRMDDPVRGAIADINDRFKDDIQVLQEAGEAFGDIIALQNRMIDQVKIDELITKIDRARVNFEASDKTREDLEAYRAEVAALKAQADALGGGERDQSSRIAEEVAAANQALTATQQLVWELGDAIEDNITNVFTELLSGALTFEEAMRKILSSILVQIGEVLARQAMIGAFGGMQGGGIGGFLAGIFHEGGVIGQPKRSGYYDPRIFYNAPKYHTGGIAGLKPNEVPTILEKGEEVLTANDPRHRNNGGLNSGVGGVVINNLLDRDEMSESLLESSQGTRSIMNVIKANKADIKNMLS